MLNKIPYIVRYSFKRILLMLITTFIILTLTFFLVKLLPGEVMQGTKGQQFAYCQKQVGLGYFLQFLEEHPELGKPKLIYTDEQGKFTYYFYQRPIIAQYGAWLKGIFTEFNWGLSSAISPRSSAIYIIGQKLGPTVSINVIALLIAVPLGFIFGIISALNKNKPIDHFLQTVVMIMISVPSFVTVSLLILLFGYQLKWLPTAWPTVQGVSSADRAAAFVIPVMSLCFGTVAGFTRYTRAELCEVMSSEFLLLARTKGLTKKQCVVRHALRNSLVPIVPMIIGEFIGVLSGSAILESLYGIPGIGNLFIQCISARDYNVLLVDMAVFTIIGLLANLLVDISYGIVDPRIRMGAKAQ